MMAQGFAAGRAEYNGIAAAHADRRYGSGHGIASGYSGGGRRGSGDNATAVMMMMMQMFGLTTAAAVHVTVGRYGKMHFFDGRPFGFTVFAAAVIREFYVFEQGLEPL